MADILTGLRRAAHAIDSKASLLIMFQECGKMKADGTWGYQEIEVIHIITKRHHFPDSGPRYYGSIEFVANQIAAEYREPAEVSLHFNEVYSVNKPPTTSI